MWLIMAMLYSFFGGITAIFSKIGLKKTDSDVALSLRTTVVLVYAWIIVLITGAGKDLLSINPRALVFLLLSGLASSGAAMGYYKAISQVDVTKVAPIDKSSTVLTVLGAIVIFGETDHLGGKLFGVALMLSGALLMLEKSRQAKTVKRDDVKKSWIFYALFSATCAASSALLAKAGLRDVPSTLATALQMSVVLILTYTVVFAKGKQAKLLQVGKRELLFITLSRLSTGSAWLCYFYAIKFGQVSVVAPFDKLTLFVTVCASYIVFREKLSKKAFFGMLLMLAGMLFMAFLG